MLCRRTNPTTNRVAVPQRFQRLKHTIVAASREWQQQEEQTNPSSGSAVRFLRGHEDGVRCLLVLPQQPRGEEVLASGPYDRTVRLWDLDAGQCLHVLCGHNGLPTSLLLLARSICSLDPLSSAFLLSSRSKR
ncbi:WD40 repeat domain-containing protein [Balamuthia mandrillaris]